MGKLSKPDPEELKFVYSLMANGYSDRNILEEYCRLYEKELLKFPFREDERFVKDRRKEFEAAKEVLTTQIEEKLRERIRTEVKAEQDPALSEARKNHQAALIDFVGAWEDGLEYFCQNTVWLLQDIAAGDVQKRQLRRSHLETSGAPLGLVYSASHQDKPFTAEVWIETDPLCQSLRSHLSSDEYRPVWDAWNDLKQGVEQQATTVEQRIRAGQLKYRDSPPRSHEDQVELKEIEVAWEEIEALFSRTVASFQNLLAQVRMRGLIPGSCDLCPEKALTTGQSPERRPAQRRPVWWRRVDHY
jgi:hypothetical protein